jgi:GDP-4-dehydro-6-deoxy-D-mannose reductase
LRSLITGVGGFAGSHLADALLAASPEMEIWGCDLNGERRTFHPPALRLLAADLCDPVQAQAVIEQCRPDRIYHLAGQAFVGDSWNAPWQTIETNLRSQVNLFEALRGARLEARMLVVSSAEIYGRVPAGVERVDEQCPLQPDNPYAVSKAAQDLLGLQYYLSYGWPVVRVRPFNHIGPRQNSRFVVPAFASQVAAIEAGRQPPVLRVGDLSAQRDLTDVRDMVQAYRLALEVGRPGEAYNLGTGQLVGIREVLEGLLRLSRVAVTVETDPARLRPSTMPAAACDASKFRAATGWQPRVPLEQSLRDVLDYERAQIGR